MEINASKFAAALSGITSIVLICGTGYFLYTVFFEGTQPQEVVSVQTINASVFGPRIQAAAVVLTGTSQKLSFKKSDFIFTETPLYKNFTDLPEVVPLSDSRGRPDPFVPYVAP